MAKDRDRDYKKMRKFVKAEVRMNSIDQLAWMSDDDLTGLLMDLVRDRDNVLGVRGKDPLPLEVEICYVQREMEIRSDRRRAHLQWLANLGTEGTQYDAKTAN